MKNQETIYNLLAGEGDCYCVPKIAPKKGRVFWAVCVKCGVTNRFYSIRKLSEDGQDVVDDGYSVDGRIDLTTPEGLVWMLVRLEKWDRKAHFDTWVANKIDVTVPDEMSSVVIHYTLKWLASDAKDGKAPALYNALCEFLNLSEEEV